MIDINIIKFCIHILIGGNLSNQNELRNKLSAIISSGLSASSISKVTNISRIDLSRFKNGQICLIDSDAEYLEKYLDMVNIPTNLR